jgi:hypothetical protein
LSEQGELLPKTREQVDRDHFLELARSRAEAALVCTDCVKYLFKVVTDVEEDTDRRIMAAAEILAFAKVP